MKAPTVSETFTSPIRVVIVDDHTSLRDMLGIILKLDGGYEVVGEASGGMEAMRICRDKRPELVILDLALPELSGSHLIRLLLQESWPVRVVVYSGAMDEDLLREALAEGPHGFVSKEDSLPELRSALRAVISGSRHISRCSEHLMPRRGGDELHLLTTQECAVLQMIAEGAHTKEIAITLGASEKTVDHHRQNVMKKLGLHDVAGITRYALKRHMVRA